MYTLGVYLLGTQTLSLPSPDWPTVCYILLVAHTCYLMDRVKFSDSRQDPADAIALPDRAILFSMHSKVIRAVLVAELVIATAAGFLISPTLILIPLAALIGVQFYAGRGAKPGSPRFKDLPGLKSFFISTAHLALVIAVLWGNDHRLIEHPRLPVILDILGLWLIVSADAILCDLDDRESDAIYGTLSLPVLLGSNQAWILAQLILLAGCIFLALESQYTIPSATLSSAVFLSTLPTRHMKNRRDLVDARLLPIVLISVLLT